jgi:hypothetical protein
MSNIYADVLKIAGGDFSVAERRVTEFSEFANTVPAAPESGSRDSEWPAASQDPPPNTSYNVEQSAAPEPAHRPAASEEQK